MNNCSFSSNSRIITTTIIIKKMMKATIITSCSPRTQVARSSTRLWGRTSTRTCPPCVVCVWTLWEVSSAWANHSTHNNEDRGWRSLFNWGADSQRKCWKSDRNRSERCSWMWIWRRRFRSSIITKRARSNRRIIASMQIWLAQMQRGKASRLPVNSNSSNNNKLPTCRRRNNKLKL